MMISLLLVNSFLGFLCHIIGLIEPFIRFFGHYIIISSEKTIKTFTIFSDFNHYMIGSQKGLFNT